MNTEYLRYILMIDNFKSINQAAKALYISQPTLSRILQTIEADMGIIIFERTKKGVITTYEGKVFIERIRKLVSEMEQIEKDYFQISHPDPTDEIRLYIGAQHSSPAIDAFVQFYQKECIDSNSINLVVQENSGENLLEEVADRKLDIGIIHFVSSQEDSFLETCNDLGLKCDLLGSSPICVQVRSSHPLAQKKDVTIGMLAPYLHITFSDEDLTGINSCSDIDDYNWTIQQKRIVVNERGTLRDLLLRTDGYYIGNDNRCNLTDVQSTVCIPIRDYPYLIKTVCVYTMNRLLTLPEKKFLNYLQSYTSN